jgi:CDP-diacylglycerol--glycerol-3-phosphate 3-phosphatidyltransferase
MGRRANMNLPNSLSVTRIFLVPLLVVVLLTKFEGRMILGVRKELVGAAIFGLASLTDWLDGYLARRRGQITALGQFIDPFADKLLTIAAFISLVQMDLAPAWMVAIIIGREFAVTALRALAHARGETMPASPLGKIKMVAQVVAILALILGQEHLQGFYVIGHVALWVVVAAALISAADYFRRFGSLLSLRPPTAGDAESHADFRQQAARREAIGPADRLRDGYVKSAGTSRKVSG